jgi:predicted nucleotidyltransferase
VFNGEQWLQALGDRNLTTHIYNETQAEQIEKYIRCDYYPLLKRLKETLTNEFHEKKQMNDEETGLSKKMLQKIKKVLNPFLEIEKICIFGSRAKGTFKRGSDIDIALLGEQITPKIVQKIAYQLNEETTMPYFLISYIMKV